MGTNVGMGINLEPNGEMRGRPGKQESFIELLKNIGLRIRISDSNPRSAAYVL